MVDGADGVVSDRLPGAAKAPAFRTERERRDLRLDACRGLALWFIFLDHIPDNVLAWLTIRNYGFSDTTEVFVFVSGYTCMLAYGGALQEQGWPTTVTRALRRGWEIYVAFLLLLIASLAVIWIAGGGSTIRGVSETESVKPFVCTKYNGKDGTYAIMANGTVRFVYADIPDDLFKAMCTLKGADPAQVEKETILIKEPMKVELKADPAVKQ